MPSRGSQKEVWVPEITMTIEVDGQVDRISKYFCDSRNCLEEASELHVIASLRQRVFLCPKHALELYHRQMRK